MTPEDIKEWNELNEFAVDFLQLEGEPYYIKGVLYYKNLKKVAP